jgi:hypothetical protein
MQSKGKLMNHQPFKDWLLSEDKLAPEQAQALQEHLETCDTCRKTDLAWSDVEILIKRVPPVKPAPGFTVRWQEYLSAHQLRKQKRFGWITIGINVLIISSILIVLATHMWSLLQTPGPYLLTWFLRLINLLSLYFTFQNFNISIPWSMPVYSIIGLFILVGMTSFMSVLWLATYRKIKMARRLI